MCPARGSGRILRVRGGGWLGCTFLLADKRKKPHDLGHGAALVCRILIFSGGALNRGGGLGNYRLIACLGIGPQFAQCLAWDLLHHLAGFPVHGDIDE